MTNINTGELFRPSFFEQSTVNTTSSIYASTPAANVSTTRAAPFKISNPAGYTIPKTTVPAPSTTATKPAEQHQTGSEQHQADSEQHQAESQQRPAASQPSQEVPHNTIDGEASLDREFYDRTVNRPPTPDLPSGYQPITPPGEDDQILFDDDQPGKDVGKDAGKDTDTDDADASVVYIKTTLAPKPADVTVDEFRDKQKKKHDHHHHHEKRQGHSGHRDRSTSRTRKGEGKIAPRDLSRSSDEKKRKSEEDLSKAKKSKSSCKDDKPRHDKDDRDDGAAGNFSGQTGSSMAGRYSTTTEQQQGLGKGKPVIYKKQYQTQSHSTPADLDQALDDKEPGNESMLHKLLTAPSTPLTKAQKKLLHQQQRQ